MKITVEQKNIIESIISGIIKLFNTAFFKNKIVTYINTEYDKGQIRAEDFFQMNFVKDERELDFMKAYVGDLTTNITDDINKELRTELQRLILEGKSIEQIKAGVKDFWENPKYKNRLKMVLRTEGVRAGNKGLYDSAVQSGLNPKKYLYVTMDDRTSDICKAEAKKYPESKAIALNEEFVVTVKNKTYSAQHPPFHPNCRTTLMLTEV